MVKGNVVADDLVAVVTAAVVVVLALADVVFDGDCIAICVAVVVDVVTGLFIVVAVDDAAVPAVAHVDA